jgi:hypothetical protein
MSNCSLLKNDPLMQLAVDITRTSIIETMRLYKPYLILARALHASRLVAEDAIFLYDKADVYVE